MSEPKRFSADLQKAQGGKQKGSVKLDIIRHLVINVIPVTNVNLLQK